MQYVIWGAGTWGRRFLRCLKVYGYEAVAFIDSNQDKQGKTYEELPVISFDKYKAEYSHCLIVIAVMSKNVVDIIKNELNKNGIFLYITMLECPRDIFFQYDGKKFPFDEALNKIHSEISNKRIVISGINFFGILLYDYLVKNQREVAFLNDKNVDINNKFIKNFNESYNIISEEECNYDSDVILQTDPICGTDKSMLDYNKNKLPFFEFLYLSDYQNPNLSQFKNIYTSEDRCFIVATGPSLKMEDLQLLHDRQEITFSMNKVYKAFHLTSWRPTYYFASDPEMLKVNEKELVELDLNYKFLTDSYPAFWQRNMGLEHLYRFHSIFDYARENEDDFSEDVTKGMYASMTVAYLALQMAVYMGFKKIYIIGSDCDYYGKDGTDDKTHFVAGYNDVKNTNKPYVLDVEQIFKSYEAAKCYADKHGIKIYNATRGGKLEVFERVEFDSLF